MLMNIVLLLCFVFLNANAAEYHLPKYIKPCSRSKNFSECALKSAEYAIPFLIKGDKQLKIASMNPVKVDLVELQGTNNLKLKLRNVEVYGLDNLKILSVSADFNKRRARMLTSMERSVTLGDYEIDGRIMIFPITGHGPLNMSMYNAIYQYDSEWDLVERNGKQYMNITHSKYDYTVSKITYDFKNLFNGDKMLGEQMNKFLNENWQLVNEDLKAPFLETLLAFHNNISKKIFSQIPYDELFLP